MKGLGWNNTIQGLYWTGGEIHDKQNHTDNVSEGEILRKKLQRDDAELL